jgi:integrase
MTVKEAVNLFRYHQKSNLKQKSQETYKYLLGRFEQFYAKRPIESIGTDDIFQFLEEVTQNTSKSTRYLRYAQVKSFFGFLIDQCRLNMENPCSSPLVSKTFKMPRRTTRKILDKEAVEEMVYNTKSMRDRLILELMARCGLRVGELLKIKVSDISDRKITLQEPKSGKESEVAYMPEQIAKRLNEYIKAKDLSENDRIFKICYSTARVIVKRLGERLNIDVSPHDLRRYSATYASRNGVPLEIVSKVFLRHQDLRTTQIYLGKVSESEAIRWMDVLHGK